MGKKKKNKHVVRDESWGRSLEESLRVNRPVLNLADANYQGVVTRGSSIRIHKNSLPFGYTGPLVILSGTDGDVERYNGQTQGRINGKGYLCVSVGNLIE